MKKSHLFLLSLSMTVPALASASVEKVDFEKGTGSTAFHATGKPSSIKINGTGAAPKGSLVLGSDGKVKGELTLDLTSLDTGMSLRTNHMKEKYLEVGKYPQSKLALTEISLPAGNVGKDFAVDKVAFKGNLTLHGVTKPISGTARVEQHGGNAAVHAEFPVKISDYSIAVPVFAGVTVADEVALVIDANAPVAVQ